jgi:hypothetical protein
VIGLVEGETVVVLADATMVDDMLTDGVALMDTMLADTEGETDVEGVVDGVGEEETRLCEGKLVSDDDGVALADTMVAEAEALFDSAGVMTAGGLADNDAPPLALVAEGEAGCCEGVT